MFGKKVRTWLQEQYFEEKPKTLGVRGRISPLRFPHCPFDRQSFLGLDFEAANISSVRSQASRSFY